MTSIYNECYGLSLDRISFDLQISFFLYAEPRCKKNSLRGFRPGPAQTGLYSHRKLLKA